MSSESSYPVVLPPKYYLEYFEYLLDFVRKMYEPLLNENEISFLSDYSALTDDARCLFVRLSNRKGPVFKLESLSYPEIEDYPSALSSLTEVGFVAPVTPALPHHTEAVLQLLTKPELLSLAQSLEPVIMPLKSIKKADLVRWLRHEYSPEDLLREVTRSSELILVRKEAEVMMMKFLFFGNRHDDMTEFVIRDLGHVRFQPFGEEMLSVRFRDRKEIDDCLAISLVNDLLNELIPAAPPEDIYDWLMAWHEETGTQVAPAAAGQLERLILKAASHMERRKLPEQALHLYSLITIPPSRERQARLLAKLGLPTEAAVLCREMIASPRNADELYFGNDFLNKLEKSLKRSIRQTTKALQEAGCIQVPYAFRGQVENGAAQYFMAQGYDVIFCENRPWRALFGLLFWDIIYDTNVQAIHHPLQRIPSDFFQPGFFEKRKEAIRRRLDELPTPGKIAQTLHSTYAEKADIANVMVHWDQDTLQGALSISRLLTPAQLHPILWEMASDLKEKARGFPDLLIWKGAVYRFVEIKSPTDHLSSQQLYWQHFFRELQVHCEILRIEWERRD